MVHLVPANQNVHITVCIMVCLTTLSVEHMIQALICMNTFLLELKNIHVLVRHKHLNRLVKNISTYRVIRKSLWDFQPLRYSSWDGHAEGEHVNRGSDTPSFCSTLQVLDISTPGDAADVNPVIKFLPHTLHMCGRNFITGLISAASPRVDISSTCKVGQKLGVFLPLLICSPSV